MNFIWDISIYFLLKAIEPICFNLIGLKRCHELEIILFDNGTP